MRLWTIQPKEVYEQLINNGYVTCDPTLAHNIVDNSFTKAYKYIVKLMQSRGIVKPSNVDYPIWAWHTYNWKHHKPDLRTLKFGKRGDKKLCIELEVPDNEVLLTDFDAWHFVLNDCYFDTSTNEKEYDRQHDWFDRLPAKQRERVKIRSWERITDVSKFKSDWISRGAYVQATFFVLKAEYVRKVQEFTCR